MPSKVLQIVGAIKTPTPNWEQTDETKNDYIKNKPNLDNYITSEQFAAALNITDDTCYMDAGSISDEGGDLNG